MACYSAFCFEADPLSAIPAIRFCREGLPPAWNVRGTFFSSQRRGPRVAHAGALVAYRHLLPALGAAGPFMTSRICALLTRPAFRGSRLSVWALGGIPAVPPSVCGTTVIPVA